MAIGSLGALVARIRMQPSPHRSVTNSSREGSSPLLFFACCHVSPQARSHARARVPVRPRIVITLCRAAVFAGSRQGADALVLIGRISPNQCRDVTILIFPSYFTVRDRVTLRA